MCHMPRYPPGMLQSVFRFEMQSGQCEPIWIMYLGRGQTMVQNQKPTALSGIADQRLLNTRIHHFMNIHDHDIIDKIIRQVRLIGRMCCTGPNVVSDAASACIGGQSSPTIMSSTGSVLGMIRLMKTIFKL